jgi:hypothetical protein
MSFNFDLFILLPTDIINIIKKYLTHDQLRLTNKTDWKDFYENRINQKSYYFKFTTRNTYIRTIIMNKLSFILENYIILVDKKTLRHWKTSIYKYKKKKYKNYIEFLKWYTRKNNSIKCLNLILALEKDIKK